MQYVVVDAFTARAFAGNPAAVVFESPDSDLGDATRQAIAAEFNLSETAFVTPLDSPHRYRIRYFTPAREVALCGHATLASAWALYEGMHIQRDQPITFITGCDGQALTCAEQRGLVTMDFPSIQRHRASIPVDVGAALGTESPVVDAFDSALMLGLVLGDAQAVRSCRPDHAVLAGLHEMGVGVSAAGDEPGVDFVSRYFAPNVGIAEDPVTGSAHCVWGPYWAQQLGRSVLGAVQVSPRGGRIEVRCDPSQAPARVALAGRAVTVMRGQLLVPRPGTIC